MTENVTASKYFEQAVVAGAKLITPKQIANYLINRKINIDEVFPAKIVEEIVQSSKTADLNIDELKSIIKTVVNENPKIAEDYKKGKQNVVQFAIGQVMYRIKKKIDIELVRKLILEELK